VQVVAGFFQKLNPSSGAKEVGQMMPAEENAAARKSVEFSAHRVKTRIIIGTSNRHGIPFTANAIMDNNGHFSFRISAEEAATTPSSEKNV
jgi:hypothetical protein